MGYIYYPCCQCLRISLYSESIVRFWSSIVRFSHERIIVRRHERPDNDDRLFDRRVAGSILLSQGLCKCALCLYLIIIVKLYRNSVVCLTACSSCRPPSQRLRDTNSVSRRQKQSRIVFFVIDFCYWYSLYILSSIL